MSEMKEQQSNSGSGKIKLFYYSDYLEAFLECIMLFLFSCDIAMNW